MANVNPSIMKLVPFLDWHDYESVPDSKHIQILKNLTLLEKG